MQPIAAAVAAFLFLSAPASLPLPGHSTDGSTNSSATPSDTGIFPDKIVLGQTCALKGPASGLGQGMQAGLEACFARTNKAGGLAGRHIELETLNDSYEPEACELATRTLIEKSKVFLLIGGVGTPTAKVAMPICEQGKVPYVAPFTGAELLRTPTHRYVINLRASYYQETERLAKLLVDERGLKRVACLYQHDAFGQAGLDGFTLALERRQLKLVATGTFERNTVAVGSALTDIAAGNPDAVVMVGPYKPVATFEKSARQNAALEGATYATISFVGTLDLLKEVGAAGEGTIVSQVVPYPWDTSLAVVKEFQADMKAAGLEASIGFTSLEGYLAGRFFCQAFAKIQGAPTRESFIEAVQATGTFDLGGVTLQFGPEDHQGSDAVFLTQFKDGKVVPIH